MSYGRGAELVDAIRRGPLGGAGLFLVVWSAQLGHLIEHIAVAIQGKALLGPQFDTEQTHLVFNTAIALLSVLLVVVHPRNPWVYPLALLALFHGIEHLYIFNEFLRTGLSNKPGLLGLGGVIGLVTLEREEVHNVYNGLEMTFMVLGLWHEIESAEG